VKIKFSLKGRATRSEWLLWRLIRILVYLVIKTFEDLIKSKELPPAFYLILVIISIITLWINISFDVRRLHDIDFSGWWILLNFIPFVSLSFFFILAIKKGTHGPNSFGADPLQQKQSDGKSDSYSYNKSQIY
jgi:uncharacterized membrane protein YhaH (DUF805 family)